MSEKSEKLCLVRDASELSQRVENFLNEKHFEYDVFYSERNNKLPIIYTADSFMPYRGESGFNIFKISH
jgi:hypothetical protein